MSNKQVEMSPIEDVVAAIARGEMIVMVDDDHFATSNCRNDIFNW